MADKKISALTGASTPLAGTEVLPIVQSGATVKVAVSNLTAGRAVSALSYAPTGSALPVNGLFLPATNSVGIATNSEERARVFESGGVSIGNTTDPGATNLSVTGIITQSTTLAAYVWVNWNPSDVIGTSTVPSTGTAYNSTFVSTTFSAGTSTTTFSKAGKYLVNVMNGFAAGAAYTFSRRFMNLGGTATRYLNSNAPAAVGDASISSNYNVSTVFYVVATAGQTITINPTLEVTGAGATSSYSGLASATFLYCGV
jgi:hypothetical protein